MEAIIATSALILFGLAILVLYLIAPGKYTKEQKILFQHRMIAHRGLHKKDRSIPENSLSAFRAAIEAGYGIELDIQLTKDNQIVVFHDNTLDRVCNIKGKVNTSTYAQISKYKLYDTEERIPLFKEVLDLVNGRIPLIIELKNGANNRLLCERAYQLLKNYHGIFCVESFHPIIVHWFKKNAPDILRGQLSAPAGEFKGEMKGYLAFGLSRLLSNFYARPQFIAYHKRKFSLLVKLVDAMGAIRVVWTVRDINESSLLEKNNDVIIFEFYQPSPYFSDGDK